MAPCMPPGMFHYVCVCVWGGRQKSRIFACPYRAEVPPTNYAIGTGALSTEVKRQGRTTDHLTPTSVDVKKTWIYIPTPPYVFLT
jgi:hypothetical protein